MPQSLLLLLAAETYRLHDIVARQLGRSWSLMKSIGTSGEVVETKMPEWSNLPLPLLCPVPVLHLSPPPEPQDQENDKHDQRASLS